MPLGHTLNFLFLEIFYRELKKLSLLFQFLRNLFPKMEIIYVHVIVCHDTVNKYRDREQGQMTC